MSKKAAYYGLFLLVVCAALLFRVVRLDLRPMHHDEANQAVKFGDLLERGEYRYDPTEHHGPSLYYCSLPFAWVRGETSFASLDEVTLRLVPALFGVGIILLFLLFKGGYSPTVIFFSGIFAAVSPVMVFYSRFYIQETLLVFFLVGAMASSWRYHVARKWGWAAATGFFLGMMYATKETSVIAFAALFAALVLARIFEKADKRRERWRKSVPAATKSEIPPVPHLLVLLGSALLVCFFFFSSFFQNPKGILDSVLAFKTYFSKAAGAGFHSYPWPYYLKMLALSRYGSGPIWSEALILALALAGCVAAFRPRPWGDSGALFRRFVFFYALLSTAVYSLIPYKTPWNMLPFYVGIILLAGSGAAFLLEAVRKPVIQSLIFVILGLGLYQLGGQSYRANFVYEADPRNPYVYAQTSPDFLNLVRRVENISRLNPDGRDLLIKVITYPDEAWPLPWYLRGFTRVGYWQEADEAGELEDVPIVISSPDKTEGIWPELQLTHQSEFFGLRPEVLLALSVRKDLWENFLETRR
jgi:uncharacterized protein (TIGR03663 family)